MTFVSTGVRSSWIARLAVLPLLFALPGGLVAADQSAAGNLDSRMPLQAKDFVRQFSAKDLLKQQLPKRDFAKAPLIVLPPLESDRVVAKLQRGPKQCSIPLLEARVQRSFDTRGIVRIPAGHFDGVTAPNPAPTCKNWNETHH